MPGTERPRLPFRSVNKPGRTGYVAGLQRHHLLPLQLLRSRGLGRMIEWLGTDRIGIHDFRRNGLLLPATDPHAMRMGMPLHRGPHRHYSEMVIERAGQIEAGWQRSRGANPERAAREALMRLDLLQKALRRRLLDPRRWAAMPLNRRDPALDFSHLDRMAEALWTATSPGQAAAAAPAQSRNWAEALASAADASRYWAASAATRSATLSTAATAPIPCPDPQMSFHALASELPPEPKFIAEGSLSGRLSGSSPAAAIEARR